MKNYKLLIQEYGFRELESAKELYNKENYVYILLADDDPVIIGEGTGSRAKVIFPGYSIPSHIKAFSSAMTTLLSSSQKRLILEVNNKREAKGIETELHSRFEFKTVSLDDKNLILYYQRLTQLGVTENENFTIGLLPLILATGSDAGTWKKLVPHYEKLLPGFKNYANRLFGDYYKDV